MIKFSMDHAFITITCLASLHGQLWEHRDTVPYHLLDNICLTLDLRKKIILIHIGTLQSSNFAPFKWVETFCSWKHVHMEIYSSFIPHCWNLKGTKMSFSGWKNQGTVIYTGNEMISSHEKSWRKSQCLLPSERINLRSLLTVSPTTRHFAIGKLRDEWYNQIFSREDTWSLEEKLWPI